MTASSPCPFLAIPTELRLIIYEDVFTSAGDRTIFVEDPKPGRRKRVFSRSWVLLPDWTAGTDPERVRTLEDLDAHVHPGIRFKGIPESGHYIPKPIQPYPSTGRPYSTALLHTCRQVNVAASLNPQYFPL